jgi:hypothetical protein
MRRLFINLWICCAFLPGCATRELRSDQDRIRTALLELNTNQVMDNLVRASNGLPIIQLDYTNANANVTIEQTASLSDAVAVTDSNVFTIAATKMLQLTHQTVNTLIGSLGASHQNQVAITANPALSSSELYNAYLTFLGLPGSLQVTDGPPPPDAAHVWKKYNNQYYWVPANFGDEFFNLALVTTAQRDRLIETPEMYSVTLRKLDEASMEKPVGASFTVDIDLDPNKTIPNEAGNVYLNNQLLARLSKYQPTDETKKYWATSRLTMTFNPAKTASDRVPVLKMSIEEFKSKLPLAVQIKLETTPPPAPTTKELLDRIPFRVPQVQSMHPMDAGK